MAKNDETKDEQKAEVPKDGNAQRREAKRTRAEEIRTVTEDAKKDHEEARRQFLEESAQKREDDEATKPEVQRRGADFKAVSGGLSADPRSMRRAGITEGPPKGEAPETEQARRGVEANTLGEHKLNKKAAADVKALTSEVKDGVTYVEVPEQGERSQELLNLDREVNNRYTGRLGTMAPRTATGDPDPYIGTAPLNKVQAAGFGTANQHPHALVNYVVLEEE